MTPERLSVAQDSHGNRYGLLGFNTDAFRRPFFMELVMKHYVDGFTFDLKGNGKLTCYDNGITIPVDDKEVYFLIEDRDLQGIINLFVLHGYSMQDDFGIDGF